MPTPHKNLDNMTKHLTRSERRARQAAEDDLRGGKRATIKAPDWLSDAARQIFEATKRRMRALEVLEPADIDLLAMYCDAVARYQAAIATVDEGGPKSGRAIGTAQSWSRIALAYAEKLGISAAGRARLARKKASEQPVDDMEALLGDVQDYVNGDL